MKFALQFKAFCDAEDSMATIQKLLSLRNIRTNDARPIMKRVEHKKGINNWKEIKRRVRRQQRIELK